MTETITLGMRARGAVARCGDGFRRQDLESDAGVMKRAMTATVDTDACLNRCVARCGDESAKSVEACDDGNDEQTDSCLNDCTEATCGDGYVQEQLEKL